VNSLLLPRGVQPLKGYDMNNKRHGGVAPSKTQGGGPNGRAGHSNSAEQEMRKEMRNEERSRAVKERRIKERKEKLKRDNIDIELDSAKVENGTLRRNPMQAIRDRRMLGDTVRVVDGKVRRKF